MSGMLSRGILVAVLVGLAATAASAQQPRSGVVELGAGWARFVDDAPIDRGVWSGGARWAVSPRLFVGPEVTYMRGPGDDRQWHVTGNATFDLRSATAPRTFLVPYLIAGAGFTRMTSQVGTGPYTSSEGTFTAGAGARIAVTERFYVAPEFRLGWELHSRVGVVGGLRF